MIEGLPEKLRVERAKIKKSQKKVSEATGVSKASISNYENGTVPPTDALMKLAAFYHVSMDYLVGLEKGRRIDANGLDNEEIASIETFRDIIIKLKDE